MKKFLYVLITLGVIVGVFFTPISEALSPYVNSVPKVETLDQEPRPPRVFGHLVGFDYDSVGLKGRHQKKLDKVATYLMGHPEVSVVLEGHCDERGTREYNLDLGDRRAKAVKAYLVRKGIDPSRIKTYSYGSERPLTDGSSPAAATKNRRVELGYE